MNEPYETICSLGRDIDRLMEDRDEALKRAEAAEVEAKRNLQAALVWDSQTIGRALNLPLGADVPKSALQAIMALKERAEAAEAEVARLKALPAQPYTPRVGDVCVVTVDRASESPLRRGEVVTIVCEDDVDAGAPCVRRASGDTWLVTPDEIRPATPAERAAAGLPPESVDATVVAKHGEWLKGAAAYEAPAAPRVLPEHLAFVEASAKAWVKDREGETYGAAKISADEAASALVAAVARRDGGGK